MARVGDDPGPPADEVFDPFFREAYPELLKVGRFYHRNAHDVEELAAEIMVEVRRRWFSIDNHWAYARTCLARAVFKMRLGQSATRVEPRPANELPAFIDAAPGLDAYEGQQWVGQLLDTLPPAQHEVMKLFLKGLTYKEIANTVRKSESAVRQNFKLARDNLRPLVHDYERRPRTSDVGATREETR